MREPDSRRDRRRPAVRCVRIAGLTIAMHAGDPDLILGLPGALAAFEVDAGVADVTVQAAWADGFEEAQGRPVFDAGPIWRLYREGDGWSFRFSSPKSGGRPYKVGRFDRDFLRGEVRLLRGLLPPGPVYPLDYPLDELLVVHLLASGRGVEVHGCGVVDEDGRGILFAGQSGAGKTTMARLWEREGRGPILADDRVVLRLVDGRPRLYGTPWHGDGCFALPQDAPLEEIHFLRHSTRNSLAAVEVADAVARLTSCSFLPFHDAPSLVFTMGLLEHVASLVRRAELGFTPDDRAVACVRSSR